MGFGARIHPRYEPSAVILPARICAGGNPGPYRDRFFAMLAGIQALKSGR